MGVLSSSLTPVTGPGIFWPQDVRAEAQNAASYIATTAGRGISVTPENAFGFPAFFAAVRVLSEDVAKLPLFVFEDLDPGKRKAKDHPLYRVLHSRPNPEMTSFVWREVSMSHVVTWGNCYSEKVKTPTGEVAQLWPIRPDRVSVRRNERTDAKFYRIRMPQGGTVDLAADEVFHVPGLGYDGHVGYSVINILSRAIAIGMSAQEYAASLWANNARPGGVLQVPPYIELDDKGRDKLRTQFEGSHQGLSNSQRFALLEDGITWVETQIPPADAQFIESRKFQVTEIARAMRIPPHKIGDLERATFSNIEQQALEYVQDALGGWLARWESQMRMDLFRDEDQERFFAEFNVDALLRADSLARAQSLWIQRQAGVINADEWRDIENRNPLPDDLGQSYLNPMNMVRVGAPTSADLEKVGVDGTTPLTLLDQVNAATALIRAGFEAESALAAVGLPGIDHTGLVPVTVKPEEVPANGVNP